ncbi:MAG TPA: carbohydrate ABC transporter permease [Chthoniobacteraceae bacterium]|nr:carbohydrate ABC transporter permease [Chthoniobacteraceae bacterium]
MNSTLATVPPPPRADEPAAAVPAAARRPRSPDAFKHLVLLLLLGISLFPFYMMLQISLKDNALFFSSPWLPGAPESWQWQNYLYAIGLIFPYVANSVVVSVTATLGCLAVSVGGAYFFARYKMPMSGFLWTAFLVLMLMPSIANIVPLFAVLKGLNLLNTLWALIVLGIAGGLVFSIYVLRNFIEDIPKDLFEAAEIDGASHLQQIRNVVIPMSGSIIGTLAILNFLSTWNDFLMPLIVLRDPEIFTIGVGLIYLDGEYVKQWGHIMAAFVIASLPLIVIFLFTMKLFIRGLSAGAVKG